MSMIWIWAADCRIIRYVQNVNVSAIIHQAIRSLAKIKYKDMDSAKKIFKYFDMNLSYK